MLLFRKQCCVKVRVRDRLVRPSPLRASCSTCSFNWC